MKLTPLFWFLTALSCLAAPIAAYKLGGAELAGMVSLAAGGMLLFLQKKDPS